MPILPSEPGREVSVYRSIVWHSTVIVALLVKLVWLGGHLETAVWPTQRAAVTATLAVLLILAAPTMLASWRYRRFTLLALSVCLTSVALADVLHFRFYGDVISIAELAHTRQLSALLDSVVARLRPTDAFLFADVAVLSVASWSPIVPRSTQTALVPGPRLATSVLVAGLMLAGIPAQLIWDDPEEVFEYATTRREVAVAIGIIPHHIYDLAIHLAHPVVGRLTVDSVDRATVTSYLAARDTSRQSEPSELFGVAKGRNLIIVMAESLHDFPIDLEVAGQPVMPTLFRFAKESLRFENFYDQTHLGTTSDGEFTSLQSLHPLPVGVVSTRYASNSFHGLPAVLRDAGYATFSASGERGDFWNKRQMHPNLGFERSLFGEDYEPRETFGLGLTDGEFFRQTAPLLTEPQEPFMAFLMTQSNHHPYAIPLEHRTMELGSLDGTLLGDYLHSVHYFDTAFAELLDDLHRTGLLSRSVVAVYGDHRAFWDDVPGLARLLGLKPSHTGGIQQARTQLPFLVRLPGGERAGLRSVPGGHLDVAPTLLGLLGVDDRSVVMLGRDLLRNRDHTSAVVFRDGGLVDAEYRVVRREGASGCLTEPDQRPIHCEAIAGRLASARTQLEVSDLIIRGDLIPELRADRAREPGGVPDRHVVVIAHRGHSAAAPENTLAAIDAAFLAGSDLVEVDVRLSRDGVPVVIHDEILDRTTTGTGAVADKTLAQLRRLDAGSWKGHQFTGERIPTLEEALRTARGRGRLLLDVPITDAGPAIAQVLRSVNMSPEDVWFGTWNDAQRAAFTQHLPGATMSLAEGAPPRWDTTYFRDQQRAGVTVFEIANWSTDFIEAAHEHAMPVWVYTVNDESTMRTLIIEGVDGIETDDPDLAVRVATEMGVRAVPSRSIQPRHRQTGGTQPR